MLKMHHSPVLARSSETAGTTSAGDRADSANAAPSLVADFSLALINRTGAYYICRDIVEGCARHFADVRYWRFWHGHEPPPLLRRLLGRAMLLEIVKLARWQGMLRYSSRRERAVRHLFLDPLYVLRSRLDPRDIVLCHDIGPLTHDDLFDATTRALYREAYDRIARTGPGMVFVSEASRDEFVARFGTHFRFLEVIPLYVRSEIVSSDMRPPPGVTKPFILTIGALETRKNHERVIEAFASSGLPERGYSYVFCGPRGNRSTQIQALANSRPYVRYLGYADDAELHWLYRNAACFVLPSLLEGFGIPALEAARHGLISVIGSGCAQREAVGDAAVIVDPLSVQAIHDGIIAAIDMPVAERSRLVAEAVRHAQSLTKERFVASWSSLLARDAKISWSRE